MKLHIINKIDKDECINYVYKTEDEAYNKFKELYKEGEELDGDSVIECFYDYKGAKFDNYRLEYNIVEFGGVESLKWINRRIFYCEKRLEQYQEKLDLEKDTCYKGYGKGYWQGKLDAFEDIKEKIGGEEKI